MCPELWKRIGAVEAPEALARIGEKKPRFAWEIIQIINKFPQTIFLFNFVLNFD